MNVSMEHANDVGSSIGTSSVQPDGLRGSGAETRQHDQQAGLVPAPETSTQFRPVQITDQNIIAYDEDEAIADM